MNRRDRIVVVGAGAAGLRAAERLRELRFEGEVVMVGNEPHRPYHRPELSKQLLTGRVHADQLTLAAYTDVDARWRLNTAARGVDTGKRVLALPGGEQLAYDGLVIATGMESRHLPGAPVSDPRVHQLRTLDDATRLREALSADKEPVVVIGGGFTGCEVAASVRALKRRVTIVTHGPTLMAGALPPELCDGITRLHQSKGVGLALGVKVLHWLPQDNGIAIHLSDGQVLVAGHVVIAVGGLPSVSWLRGSKIPHDERDGVYCEPTCHVVGSADVVAAGDVACWPNLRFDDVPRRVEHWLNAVEMGRAAAENLLLGPSRAPVFAPLPRFWTEQHRMKVQVAGQPQLGGEHGRLGPGSLASARADGLVGLTTVDRPREFNRLVAGLDNRRPSPTARRKRIQEPVPTGREPMPRAGEPMRPPPKSTPLVSNYLPAGVTLTPTSTRT
ncbi:NAD(P)/FAD-dependent oxidoreductase [Kutzneria kofuensis]|uniref:NAD(P)/FAD-dependent oxidoreductase n=1 Tax=Kutzneria kofuensis TaxID=103725 RepID=UPI0028ADC177|nr:FAD-dependent oxidoreductase [Kutzneria kofuensis]